MKYLREVCTHEGLQIIQEANAKGEKELFIQGPFMLSDHLNQNGRTYPDDVMAREIARYNKEVIKPRKSIGELNHPREGNSIDLNNVSHLITELKKEGNVYIGKAKILDTPAGQKVRTFVEAGIPIHVSLRGFGSVRRTSEGDIVGDDFHLQTVDIVAEPSFKEAQMTALYESKEYYWDNGQIKEKVEQIDEAKVLKLLEAFVKSL